MERYFRVLVFGIVMMFGLVKSTLAASVATSFQFPLVDYPTNDGCLGWGGYNSAFPGQLHVADDVCASSGTDVLAVSNGTVKFAGPYKSCPNWGYLIVVEHTLSDGSVVNSIYGHIAPINGISPGVEVNKGQYIGDIMSMTCWSDHIHFGIYDGPYSEIICSYDSSIGSGSCNTHGYVSDWPGNYLDPTTFILAHSTDSHYTPTNPAPISSMESALNEMEGADLYDLNPFAGYEDGTWLSGKLGSRDGSFHVWYGGDIGYDSDGVALNIWIQDYIGSGQDGAIIVHPDSGYAVPIYSHLWQIWGLGNYTAGTITDNCGVDWFASGYGPSSEFGLPISGTYYVEDNNRWRQDVQRGYISRNPDTNEVYLNCYDASTPGWTAWSSWDGEISVAMAKAYWRNGGKEMVGWAYDNGGGSQAHIWGGVVIQDFEGAENGQNAVILNLHHLDDTSMNQASVVRGGFWDYYQYHDGQLYFGAPLGDEMDISEELGILRGYDPYCDDNGSGWVSLEERQACILEFCGSDEYESMQRFDYGTLCYDQWLWDVDEVASGGSDTYDWLPSDSEAEAVVTSPSQGELFKGEEDAVYLLDNGSKHWVSNAQFYACGYSWEEVEEYSQETVDEIPEGSNQICVYPEEGELFKGEDNDAVFILDNGSKRWISSDLFSACNYHWSDVNEHDQDLVDEISQGNHWNLSECLKQDQLFKGDGGSGAIFRFDSGLKRWVSEPQYYACNYTSLPVTTYSQSLVDAITQGNHIVCSYPSEGELFRASGSTTVYRMNQGSKRWVVNSETFEACGYSWSNIRDYIKRVVDSVPTGSNWTLASCKPNGSLARNTSNNGIYYLANGSKRWIPSAAVYEGCGFSWSSYVNYSGETMNYIPSGTTYSCR